MILNVLTTSGAVMLWGKLQDLCVRWLQKCNCADVLMHNNLNIFRTNCTKHH